MLFSYASGQGPSREKGARLEILSAVIGDIDCTDNLRRFISPDGNTLVLKTSDTGKLLVGHSSPTTPGSECSVSFVFRYHGQPMRLCTTRSQTPEADCTITPQSANYPVLCPSPWNESTWSIVAIVYKEKFYNSGKIVSKVLADVQKNYDDGKGTRWVDLKSIITEDPAPGRAKIGAVFYQSQPAGQVRCAVGIDDRPCFLHDKMSLVIDPVSMDATKKTEAELEQTKTALAKAQSDLAEAKKDTAWRESVARCLNTAWTVQGLNSGQPVPESWDGITFQLVNVQLRAPLALWDKDPQNGHKIALYPDSTYNLATETLKLRLVRQRWVILWASDETWCLTQSQDDKSIIRTIPTPTDPNADDHLWDLNGGNYIGTIVLRQRKVVPMQADPPNAKPEDLYLQHISGNDVVMSTNKDGSGVCWEMLRIFGNSV